ncbi:GGDEF domain-containing protein [Roseibium porphyridii]|uniref:diguanylate cyclase n=1 Tax=Roseibium porphyridii TaxID=2866279 RepID=A0ABY8EX82_9HYPH|nr:MULTISPECIES: GGDEF domain-containing protein [Stappiaceae]QFT32298.1 Response regulator PleD [Labrenzia sp. THAF82]WFE87637.1 GGDEF domain-containing protein [Roseibium sp. KMA01]
MADDDDHKRTIQYGESAISYIKKNVLPAYPRSYELWYTYSAGYNQGLNRAINDTIKASGRVSTDEMLTLYGRFLSPTRLGDRLDEVGSKVSREVEELVDTLKLSADATSDYGSALEQAGEKIKSIEDAEKLQIYVTHLVKSTQNAVATNRKLESQLLESKKHIENLQSSLEAIRYESLTDELTTLNNRKHFENSLERVIEQSKESRRGFALLMTDIDHFKKFNDTFGHQTGDQVLRLVALSVKQNIKAQDIACRYGGEEFGIILPHSSLEEASEIGERIRNAVMSKELVKRSTGENLGRVTISVGIATFRSDDSGHSIVARADEALYAAKNAGRNLVKTELDLSAESQESVA